MKKLIALIILNVPLCSFAFDSGSTGIDGALNITQDTALQLPPSGIFNFTTVNIAAGATLTFAKNAANTPVVILASADVLIDGTIDISGGNSPSSGDADITDDGLPGTGGVGGFDGGRGGFFAASSSDNNGGSGKGPGGGGAGIGLVTAIDGCGAGGGGHSVNGSSSLFNNCFFAGSVGGVSYGINSLLPLIGGSGGGGAAGGADSRGTGGGGGGGAIVIASSGTVSVNGSILAGGGNSGDSALTDGGTGGGGTGGGGSGGAVRIVATTLTGEGVINAAAGLRGNDLGGGCAASCQGGNGAPGRIRLEAENMLRNTNTNPTFSFAAPNPVFVSNLPGIQITSVAGIAAPGAPTGSNDIVLPQNTPNPVTVEFATSDIPAGGVITLTATPVIGLAVSADSIPIAADGTASVSINLPNGPNVLIARTTFTVTAALGQDFSRYAQGEMVEKVTVTMNDKGWSETTFITVSGKEFTWPSNAVAMN